MIGPAEPNDWIAKVRRLTRPKDSAEGLSEADIDRLIEEEREAVQPYLE
jgi:hypothetical protein